jgi:phosphatidylglycerophosphate synthase
VFDTLLRRLIDPPLARVGAALAKAGVRADHLTLFGGALALPIGWAIASNAFGLALGLILLNRLLDGLDGAVARAAGPTEFGGYLDSLCDYLFYLAVPVGFGLADPGNTPAALLLVGSYTLTAVSFLAYAAIAARRGAEPAAPKAFTYSRGLAEGAETILACVLMCLFPAAFTLIAGVFTLLCVATVLQRVLMARRAFRPPPS